MSLRVWLRGHRARTRRVQSEDAVKHVYSMRASARVATVASLAGHLGVSQDRAAEVVSDLARAEMLRVLSEGIGLGARGEQLAQRLIRAHRLVERYLADEVGVGLNRVHDEAERAEHDLSQDQVEALDARLGYPEEDPHGDPIPRSPEDRVQNPARTLLEWPTALPAEITHIEDEPAGPFREILAIGLRPGLTVEVVARAPDAVVVTDRHATHRLSPVCAAQVSVVAGDWRDEELLRSLLVGGSAIVRRIDAQCRGVSRRRLLDLGFTPGARVRHAYTSALGEPSAYRIRGTTVALRRDQAERIWVLPSEGDGENDSEIAL